MRLLATVRDRSRGRERTVRFRDSDRKRPENRRDRCNAHLLSFFFFISRRVENAKGRETYRDEEETGGTRKRGRRKREWTREKGEKGEEEEGGCCCCDRGITSAPLTRKTFRLNLVLDSTRLPSLCADASLLVLTPWPPLQDRKDPLYFASATKPPDQRVNHRRSESCIWLHLEVININSGFVNEPGRADDSPSVLCSLAINTVSEHVNFLQAVFRDLRLVELFQVFREITFAKVLDIHNYRGYLVFGRCTVGDIRSWFIEEVFNFAFRFNVPSSARPLLVASVWNLNRCRETCGGTD